MVYDHMNEEPKGSGERQAVILTVIVTVIIFIIRTLKG